MELRDGLGVLFLELQYLVRKSVPRCLGRATSKHPPRKGSALLVHFPSLPIACKLQGHTRGEEPARARPRVGIASPST